MINLNNFSDKKIHVKFYELIRMVGVTGFEPATPASRRQCSTKLSYTPCILMLPSQSEFK